MTKLGSGLPKGEANGLDSIARKLIDEPHAVHLAVVILDCKKVTTDHDSGDVEPTARIRRVEVIEADDVPLAAKMLRRAMERRTGQTVLPFDLEEDMRAVLEGVDPETGEIQ